MSCRTAHTHTTLHEKRNHTQRMLRKYVNESVAIMKPKMVKLREEEMRH